MAMFKTLRVGTAVVLFCSGFAIIATATTASAVPPPPAGAFVQLPDLPIFAGTFAAHATHVIAVPGVPAGASAWLDISVSAAPAMQGTVTAYTAGTATPTTPNLVFTAGQTTSNAVAVRTSGADTIDVHSSSAGAVVITIDRSGYYQAGGPAAAGMYGAVTPVKVASSLTIAAGASKAVVVAGVGGVPAAAAIVLTNLVVAAPTASGLLTAYPTGTAPPDTQSLAFSAGRPQASLNAVRVGTTGHVTLVNHSAVTISVTADVLGYYRTGSPTVADAFFKVAPAHVIDTSIGLGVPLGPVAAGATISALLTGIATVPSTGVAAVVVQLGARSSTSSGFLNAHAQGAPATTTPEVDFTPGRTSADLVEIPVSAAGVISIRNASPGSVQVRADIVGYYSRTSSLTWAAPQRVDTAPTADLNALSCTSSSFCMAGDIDGAVVRFNGTSWTRTLNVDKEGIESMSCVSGTFCMAADGVDVLLWDGTVWGAPVEPLSGFDAQIVSCVSSSFCVAASDTSTSTWNGSTWSAPIAIPSPPLFGFSSLSCTSTTFCMAVAAESGAAFQFNGTTWAATTLDATGAFPSVSCVGTQCVALDWNGTYFLFSGGSWSAAHADPFGSLTLEAQVSCFSATFCAAVDAVGNAATFNGATWSSTTALDASFVSCAAATFCAEVHDADAATFNGATWSAPTVADPDSTVPFIAVSCGSATSCIGVDADAALHWNGVSWSGKTVLSASFDDGMGDYWSNSLSDVSCVSATFCMAVLSGPVGVEDASSGWAVWNGTTWGSDHANSLHTIFRSVSCVSSTFCVAVGSVAFQDPIQNAGQAWVYNGSTWTSSATGLATTSLRSVSCVSTTFCVATGFDNIDTEAGTGTVFNGSTWSPLVQVDDSTGGAPSAVSCESTTLCVAVDLAGRAMNFNGSTWSAPAAVAGTTQLTTDSCTLAATCIGLDVAGTAVQYTGTGWRPPVSIDTIAAPTDLSCPTSNLCVAVDHLGYVVIGRAS
jgi:hypothetical protein